MATNRRRRDHERPVSRAQRRQEFLDAALTAIRRDGPGASMEAIAAEAGITKPILYRHFGHREGLVAALADRFADDLVDRLQRAMPVTFAIRPAIAAMIDSYIAFIEEDPALYRFLTQQTPVGDATLMGLVDRVASLIASFIGESLRLFGVDSGAALPWAYGIVGMVHLAGDRWVARPAMPRARLVEHLTSLLWEGMAGSVIRQVGDPTAKAALAAQFEADLTSPPPGA